MNIPDVINGSFELLSGIFLLNNCRVVLKDKAVKGISVFSTGFFAAWGYYNLFYYPHLHQWLSFTGGLMIVVSNTWYVLLLMKYRTRKNK